MIKKRILFYYLVSTVLSIFLSVGLLSAASSIENYSADMVEGVIEEFISAHGTAGVEILGGGSYINKFKFRDPLLGGSSDFDMRLRLKNATPEEAARLWKEVQDQIRKIVQKKFGNMTFIVKGKLVNAAQAILQKINIYPPQQILKGITDKAEAFKLFKKLGIVPNLGYEAGSIADNILEEAAEGIWGSLAVTQEMEKGSRGKRWFTDGTTSKDGTKKVLTGSPGEIHAEEGIGGVTAQERANVAKQVAEKTSSALGSDANLVKKNLTRLQRYLKQAKLLAGVKPSANDAMIDRLVKELETLEGEALEKAIASQAGAIERAVLDAWTDAHLLEQIVTKTGALNRALYSGMLESSGKWASLRGLLEDKEFKAFAKREAFFAALVLVWEAPELYQRAKKEGVASATIYATATLTAAAMPLLAHLIPMAAMWIAEQMVDYVAGYGYAAIISTQDCKDLIAGVYTVYGREAQAGKEKLPRPSIEVQDLRAYYCQNAKFSDSQMSANLSTLVQAHSENACTRYDDYKASTDAKAAVELFNKCFPRLQRLLLLEKQSAAYEARLVLQQLKGLAVDPYYDKGEAVLVKGKATVRVTAPFTMDPGTLETDLAAILRCLSHGDKNPIVVYRYKWYAGQAQAGDKPLETTEGKHNARSYTFEKAGTYKVCVALETEVHGISFELFSELKDTSVSRNPVCIDVEIREGGDESSGDKEDKKSDKPGVGDQKDGQKPPPQVQSGSYTQPSGQAGVQGGTSGQAGVDPGVSGAETGVGPGPSGQAGVPGQTETGVKGEAGVTGQAETGTTGKTETGVKGETGVTGGQVGISGKPTTGPTPTPPGTPPPTTPPPPGTPPPGTPPPGTPPPGTPPTPTPTPTPTPPTKDPKSQAEEKYKWIKDVLDYYEKLIELEKKAFQVFEKEVRKFVLKKVDAGGYPVRDKETEKKIKQLEEELKNVGVYVVKEKIKDPLTGESYLGNVFKGTPPSAAERAKGNELARLKDPAAHEEFQCLDEGLQVRRTRLPEIKQKAKVVRESKLYNNFAEYSAWNQYKEYLSEIGTLKSRLNLPDPIPSPVTLPWSYSSKCGSAGAETAEGEKTLSVRLQTDKTKLKAGETVNVKAVAEGGKPEYTYSWTGDHAGKGETVQFSSKTPGSHTLSVTVTDKTGRAASDSVTFNVDGMTVRIFKAEPSGNKIQMGGQAKFRAELTVDGKTATGDFIYRWQPHPEVSFSELDSTSTDIDAIFTKLGKTKVWVQALEKKGNILSTIAESNQIEIEVIQPKLKLTTNNKNPNVGDMVVLTVHEDPKMGDDVISFWWEYSGNAVNPGPVPNIPNSRSYSFKPKDTNPITVTVHAKTKDGKDDLGEEKATITAKSYNVTVTGPKAAGPKPQIWKCDTQLGGACPGIVEVDKEIAVHQRVEFSAEVSPKPETDLRYNWTVSGGSCTLSNPITRDVGVTCSETGSYQMTVTVRDKENIELGKGTGNLSVTISQEELNTAAAKAKPKVTVKAEKTTLTVGESVSVTATVDGGKTPYNYKWSGDYEGQGQSVRFIPKKPGDHTLSVEVTDAKGNKDSANIAFKVDTLKVTIEGLRDEVVYGTKLNLSAKPDNYQIVWKSEPAITFTPQQSLGGKTVASFNSIGRVKVWAVAQQNTGAVIGESEKKEINVTTPTFEITFDPPKGKVGDEVIATIKTTPPIDKSLLKFVWESPKRSDIRPYDTHIVRFTPKSIVPVEFLVVAKEPVKNQTLAEIKGTYTADAVKLEVALTTDKTRLKIGETATIRADVKGGKTPYIFAWKGDHTGSGPSVRFSAQKSGRQSLSVEVTDVFGNKGAADTSLIVEQPATRSVEQPATKGSAQKAPATAVGPLTPLPTATTRDRSPEEYGPTKDPNFTRPGTPSKMPLDIAAVDTHSSEFQQNQPGQSKTKTEQTPQNVMPQPESYMADPAKKPEGPGSTPQSLSSPASPGSTQQVPSSPYPPGFPPSSPGITQQSPGSPYPPSPPPDSGQSQVRTSWDKLIPPPSERGAKSPDKRWGSGTSTSSPPPPPATTLPKPPAPPPQPPPPSGTYVMAEITNRSKQNAHIFPEGEIFGPGNRFEPGGRKKVRVKVPSNNKITFHAGRNGQIIASQSWYYDPAHPDSIPVVIFDESNPYGKLVIVKGLR